MGTENILSRLTKEEKSALVSGTNFMETNPVPKKGIPALVTSDGPHGLRKQIGSADNGISQSEPATTFPTAVTTASSWNPENTRKMGAAIGEECRHYGVHVLLGPGVNIKRNPLCGRNFEYFSEEPLLAGEMGAAEVQGVQSQGVGVSVKHFALNNSENFRFMGNSVCDERTMREVYLKAFERIVKNAKPATVMCAYNQINGTFCSENRWLLTDILRKEWGFEGLVMTDWGAVKDRSLGLHAGLDLEMPGDTAICRRNILDGLASGSLTESDLDQAAQNVLNLVEKYVQSADDGSIDFDEHHALAADIATDCAVLLENDGILPLSKQEKLLAVGDLFDKMRYQGAGSSMIHSARLTTIREAFDARRIDYTFSQGYAENRTQRQDDLIEKAVDAAKSVGTVVVFAGLTDWVESEGADRETMCLPENQTALIGALLQTNKKVIVVLFGGSPVEVPFSGKAAAILNMYLPGQNGGEATARLLFGEANPAGRLAETWPLQYEDVPFGAAFGKGINEIYRESVLVGYRYYLTANQPVRYPFGYGLSYTKFAWSGMQTEQTGNEIRVTVTIRNTGAMDGAEVAQLYVSAPSKAVFRPQRELKAFQKVYLKAGESKTVNLTVPLDDLKIWHPAEKRWALEAGNYDFQLCSDCQMVKLHETLQIAGETLPPAYDNELMLIYQNGALNQLTDTLYGKLLGGKIPPEPPKLPVTTESRFTDLKQTFMGRILFNAVLSVANKQKKKAESMPDGAEKDNALKGALFLKRILESNSIRSTSMTAGKSMPWNFASGFVELSNGHLIKGIKCFLTPVKVPKLPKEQSLPPTVSDEGKRKFNE